MEINMTKPVKVQAKTIKINLKVCDEFACDLCDQNGAVLKEYDGYVPGFFPGQHFGDYVNLEIDIDTGVIKNWAVPTAEQIEKFIEGDE